jgi:hypothetical protein
VKETILVVHFGQNNPIHHFNEIDAILSQLLSAFKSLPGFFFTQLVNESVDHLRAIGLHLFSIVP